MGQNQSGPKTLDPSLYPPDVVQLQDQINQLRKKIADTRAEGEQFDKERKIEIRSLEKERLNSQINLMKLGKIAQKHISFWEYTRIIRTTFQSTEPLAITDGSTTSLSTQATNKTQTTSKSTTLVKQSSAVQYTIFAFYEAYLLKKLHIAMMLKTQKKLHCKGWKDVAMFLYDEIATLEQMFKDNVSNLLNAKYEEDTRLEQLNDAYNDHIRNQQQLIEYLETRPLLDE